MCRHLGHTAEKKSSAPVLSIRPSWSRAYRALLEEKRGKRIFTPLLCHSVHISARPGNIVTVFKCQICVHMFVCKFKAQITYTVEWINVSADLNVLSCSASLTYTAYRKKNGSSIISGQTMDDFPAYGPVLHSYALETVCLFNRIYSPFPYVHLNIPSIDQSHSSWPIRIHLKRAFRF